MGQLSQAGEDQGNKSIDQLWLLGARAEETVSFLFGEVRTIQGRASALSGNSQHHSKPGPLLPFAKEVIHDILVP